jgi:hypothetical protein
MKKAAIFWASGMQREGENIPKAHESCRMAEMGEKKNEPKLNLICDEGSCKKRVLMRYATFLNQARISIRATVKGSVLFISVLYIRQRYRRRMMRLADTTQGLPNLQCGIRQAVLTVNTGNKARRDRVGV